MNDNELITAVRESVTNVHSPTPVKQIVSRGRAVRARRRIPGLAGALALVASVALAVTTLAPSSHPASHQPTAQLAAWTVTKQVNGDIRVTVRELRNPAGLQRTLRADGLPVSVTFIGQQNPACQPYPISGSQSQRRHLLESMATPLPGNYNVMIIHPSTFPSGAGLQIAARFHHYQPPHGGSIEIQGSAVKVSPQCTGS